MLFRKSPEKFWNLIASKYAASPISDTAAYEKKIEKLKTYLFLATFSHSYALTLDELLKK